MHVRIRKDRPTDLRCGRGEEEVGVDHVGTVPAVVVVEARLGREEDQVEDVTELGPADMKREGREKRMSLFWGCRGREGMQRAYRRWGERRSWGLAMASMRKAKNSCSGTCARHLGLCGSGLVGGP